jgi:hypothetical protein
MNRMKLLVATLVGLVLFLSDLSLGWLSFVSGPIPVLFTMAIIIGLVAGKMGDALLATLLTWILGIVLGSLLAPILLPGLWDDDVWVPMLPLIIMMWSVRSSFISFEFEGTWVEAIAVAVGVFLVWLILTPILYGLSFLLAVVGGFIGSKLHERLGLIEPSPPPPPPEAIQ